MKSFFIFTPILLSLISCTKQQGRNPALAYSDKALLDSCLNTEHPFYKNSNALLPATGPHGQHTLRLNHIALKGLDSLFKLPAGKTLPEGSMIIKETVNNSDVEIYSLMYKKSGQWLWAEIRPNKEVIHSVNASAAVCTGCHGAAASSDLLFSFK